MTKGPRRRTGFSPGLSKGDDANREACEIQGAAIELSAQPLLCFCQTWVSLLQEQLGTKCEFSNRHGIDILGWCHFTWERYRNLSWIFSGGQKSLANSSPKFLLLSATLSSDCTIAPRFTGVILALLFKKCF